MDFSIKKSDFYGLKTHDMHLSLRLDPESLFVDSFDFSAAKGGWSGRARLGLIEGFPINVHLEVDAAEIEELLASLDLPNPWLKGQLLARAELNYQALEPGMPAWEGSAEGEIDQGVWQGISGDQWLSASGKAVFSPQKALYFDSLTWDLKLKEGQLLIDPIWLYRDQNILGATLGYHFADKHWRGCLGQVRDAGLDVDDIGIKGDWSHFSYFLTHQGCME